MNRRSFLIGLLSTTAAPVLAKAVPKHPVNAIGFPQPAWRKLYQGVPIREVDFIMKEWMLPIAGPLPIGYKTVTRIKGGTCE